MKKLYNLGQDYQKRNKTKQNETFVGKWNTVNKAYALIKSIPETFFLEIL